MKRSILLILLLGIICSAYSQNIPMVKKELLRYGVETEYIRNGDMPLSPVTPVNYAQNRSMLDADETIIGYTIYDLQTNACINNRFYMHDDGTMAAVWTRGIEPTAFPERGTGYNYFDGSEWGPPPEVRIENRRCGWPSYAPWGAGGEVVVVHNGEEGLEFSWRETKGTGDWTQQNYLGPSGIENDITWPRMITSGDDHEIVHLFVNSYVEYAGQPRALLYSRSNDGGDTWDPQHVILEGMGSDYYTEINADDYVLAAQGSTVVLLVASQWHDMFYMRTDDDGDTWEKEIVWEHPYPFFDWNVTIADTFFCCDGSANIALDNDGMVHVVFGINRVQHLEVGTTYYLYPYVDGVGYWNEDMDPFSNDLDALAPPQYGYANTEMVQDENYVGWMQDVDGNGTIDLNTDIMYYQQHGPSNMPAIYIDDDNTKHLIYASTTEGFEVEEFNYKHLWYRKGDQFGWSEFVDLTSDISHIFDECYYPLISGFNEEDNIIHFIFNADLSPGLAWSDDHAWQENRIIYSAFTLPELIGVDDVNTEEARFAMRNYPNPARDRTFIEIDLEEAGEIILEIADMTGKKIMEIDQGSLAEGLNKIEVDVSELPAGIYFYTVRQGRMSATQKLVVR